MNKDSQTKPKLIRQIAILLFLFLIILVCWLVNPFEFINRIIENATVTPTLTPTYEYCFWNWAYGEGSIEFDNAVMEQLTTEGIQSQVKSSSFGEIYSCDQSFHAKDLDVQMEIQINDINDQQKVADLVERIIQLLNEKVPLSQISGLGNINIKFISGENSNTCVWDRELRQCHP